MTTQTNGNNLLLQGRIVWTVGSLFEGSLKTDFQTGSPLMDKAGNQVVEYGFGLAIPKVDPTTGQPTAEYAKIWDVLHKEAFTMYPGGNIPPNFAMKYKDGDGVDHNGKLYSEREGQAGHIIITCTTRIPIKYFVFQGGNNVLVNAGIKTGDYVNVQLNIKAHPAKGNGNPGLYVNPSAVQLIQEGKEIINSPSGDQIFGQAQPAGYNGQVEMPTQPSMPVQTPPMGAPAPNYNVLPTQHQPAQSVPMQSMPTNTINGSVPTAYPSNPAMGQPAMPGQTPPMGNPAPMPGMGVPANLASPSNPTMPAMPTMPS